MLMSRDKIILDAELMKHVLGRRAYKAGREFRWIPVSDPFNSHERMLEMLQEPLSEEELLTKFTYSKNVVKRIIQKQEELKTVSSRKKDGKLFYEITEKGYDVLRRIPGAKYIHLA